MPWVMPSGPADRPRRGARPAGRPSATEPVPRTVTGPVPAVRSVCVCDQPVNIPDPTNDQHASQPVSILPAARDPVAAVRTDRHRGRAASATSPSVGCRDAYRLSQWRKEVLGYTDVPGDPNEPGHLRCMIIDSTGVGPCVLLLEVPEEQ